MRAVSYVDRLEFEFNGNLLKDAITLGDVDNDKNNELVVGNVSGDIVIFKGADCTPWKTASAYGMVASLVIGDILNEDKNYLVSITGEGWCNIFVVDKNGPCQEEEHQHNSSSNNPAECKVLFPFHTQRIMANTKVALLADIDGDGAVELVIGMSDRVVRSYRWTRVLQFTHTKSGGRLVAQNKWEFAYQIGSVTLNTNQDGTVSLMVSQPGGTYIQLNCYNNKSNNDEASRLEYHSLSSTKMRNSNVSTEIVGNIRRCGSEESKRTLYAVATLDGTLMLLDEEQILWSLQVNHQLFSVTKLDVTGDGNEEVIACSWDGLTYIVNDEHQSLRFQFDETVCTFTAGQYSLLPGENHPCLVYATFSNRIYLYYNIQIPKITTSSLSGIMESRPKVASLLSCLQVDSSNTKQLQQLYHWSLYGMPSKST